MVNKGGNSSNKMAQEAVKLSLKMVLVALNL
jgi:hypothetical protein